MVEKVSVSNQDHLRRFARTTVQKHSPSPRRTVRPPNQVSKAISWSITLDINFLAVLSNIASQCQYLTVFLPGTKNIKRLHCLALSRTRDGVLPLWRRTAKVKRPMLPPEIITLGMHFAFLSSGVGESQGTDRPCVSEFSGYIFGLRIVEGRDKERCIDMKVSLPSHGLWYLLSGTFFLFEPTSIVSVLTKKGSLGSLLPFVWSPALEPYSSVILSSSHVQHRRVKVTAVELCISFGSCRGEPLPSENCV